MCIFFNFIQYILLRCINLKTTSISRFNFYIIKLRKCIIPFIFLSFTICLILFSNSNLSSAKSGLQLWANSVVPSLFPFFVATELLSHTNIVNVLGKLLNKIMKPLFNVRGEGSFALIMGIISGYPVGAKIAMQFREKNICSKEECERLISFTNNSGPLFIIGTVGISMFGSSTIGLLLFITHILACITVGILFRFWKYNKKNLSQSYSNNYKKNSKNNNLNFSSLGEIIGNSITNSISTIMMIGGFVVLFSVVISILNSSKVLNIVSLLLMPVFNILNIPTSFITPFLTGIVEITNGINIISNIHIKAISTNIIFTAFLLGFGGISILLQVFSIISKTDLSIKPYIIGKFLHGSFAAIYTYIFIYAFPIFNLNL